MGKRKTTVYLDEDTLRSMRVFASRAGKRDSEVVEEAIREHLGITALERVWARSELDEEEALDLAYEAVRETRSKAPAAGPGLDPEELEVLALTAFGLSDKEIAARLGISEGAAATALASAFTKLRLEDTARHPRGTSGRAGR